ncbi:MAG: branched-chain amino acid ABC transporter permease [Alphaproteobacteria bacterium]|nr:MAG: branched-chain amino acid ABC transporter permease [Alphaproteobacteria bacterium]
MLSDQLLQMSVNGLMIGLVYALIALGLTLVFGVMRIVNFAHGELYMLGAFAIYQIYGVWHVNFLVALLITAILLGFAGVLIEKVLLSRLQTEFLASFIVTLGLASFLQAVVLLIFGLAEQGVPAVLPGVVRIGGVSLSLERLVLIPVSLVLIAGTMLFVHRSRAGRAMRAVSMDQDAAALYGVDIGRTRAICMALGAGLAGVAGALVAPLFTVNPHMGGEPLLKGFIIIVVGGMGSIHGALLAGILLGLVEAFGTTLWGAPAAYIASFLVLIGFLLFRPNGLFGKA